ncbi:meiosis-specific protein PAIR3-like [Silene latifolia]|uniref:meiosis-specific protein PAIR3-like n=1 Tax=Silene latifolia TaxID=37657 RepID=UPI003D776854
MAWETKKTCLDVLMSTSEEIHSDLQDVECQIQADVRKLTRKVTFKRKQLQSRLQEKQELLKVTHDNWKRAIHKSLQDYIVVVEGMEAQLVELKGVIAVAEPGM